METLPDESERNPSEDRDDLTSETGAFAPSQSLLSFSSDDSAQSPRDSQKPPCPSEAPCPSDPENSHFSQSFQESLTHQAVQADQSPEEDQSPQDTQASQPNLSGGSRKRSSERVLGQAERILMLMGNLQTSWISIDELSALHPQINKRTIYRDLEMIRNFFGEAFQTDSAGRMHVIPSKVFFVQPLDLTNAEALSLYLLCQLAAQNSCASIPYLDSVLTALQKLRSLSMALFEQTKNQLFLERIHIETSPTAPQTNSSIFSDLLLAHEKSWGVVIEYDSIFDKRVIQTFLEPYHLHFTRRAWYVTGRSGFHHEIRTFHLERILSLKIIPDSTFVIPIGWSYEKFRGNAWSMIRGSEDVEVVLRFSALVARNVAAVRWHKNQIIEKQSNGTIIFRVLVSGTSEILWWILGYGDQVEVLSPQSLRQAVQNKILAMRAIYEDER